MLPIVISKYIGNRGSGGHKIQAAAIQVYVLTDAPPTFLMSIALPLKADARGMETPTKSRY